MSLCDNKLLSFKRKGLMLLIPVCKSNAYRQPPFIDLRSSVFKEVLRCSTSVGQNRGHADKDFRSEVGVELSRPPSPRPSILIPPFSSRSYGRRCLCGLRRGCIRSWCLRSCGRWCRSDRSPGAACGSRPLRVPVRVRRLSVRSRVCLRLSRLPLINSCIASLIFTG